MPSWPDYDGFLRRLLSQPDSFRGRVLIFSFLLFSSVLMRFFSVVYSRRCPHVFHLSNCSVSFCLLTIDRIRNDVTSAMFVDHRFDQVFRAQMVEHRTKQLRINEKDKLEREPASSLKKRSTARGKSRKTFSRSQKRTKRKKRWIISFSSSINKRSRRN